MIFVLISVSAIFSALSRLKDKRGDYTAKGISYRNSKYHCSHRYDSPYESCRGCYLPLFLFQDFFSNVIPFIEVINAQLNAFLIETRRTIAGIDMMVRTNLVEDVICRYFCLKKFLKRNPV